MENTISDEHSNSADLQSSIPEIALVIDDQVWHLQFNRPEKKNALTVAMYAEMVRIFQAAKTSSTCRVLVLAGNPECFTAGNDLMDFRDHPPAGPESPVFQYLLELVDFPKPLVAAVEGPAIGIGTTMLLHCDFVFAGGESKFAFPFVNLGLCPEAASSLLLPRRVGGVRAAELLMLGEQFDAARAFELGLINRVTQPGEALAVAHECASSLASKAPAALRTTKKLIRQHSRDAVHQALMSEGTAFFERLRSPEVAEAIAAFVARRTPDFSRFE